MFSARPLLALGLALGTPLIAQVAIPLPLDDPRLDRQRTGHPVITTPIGTRTAADLFGITDIDSVPVDGTEPDPVLIPTIAPLAEGAFVNFESPPVKSIAVNVPGNRLYAANTPNNSLSIIDTNFGPNGVMKTIDEIPVGLDPVTVAILPGSGGRVVWVVNHVSDDISVVDTAAGRVLQLIEVGDRPTNLVFDSSGRFAYVLTEGEATGAGSLVYKGYLSTIDVETGTVVDTLELPMLKPRGLVYHEATNRLLVTALHSGNNTTSVGFPLRRQFTDGTTDIVSTVEIMRDFSITSALFAASGLAPYPEPSGVANPPRVHRIVTDAGQTGEWQDLVALLADTNGNLLPGVASQYNTEFSTLNAEDLLEFVVREAPDTVNNDLLILSTASPDAPTIETIVDGVGTSLLGMGIHPTSERVFVSNMEPKNLVRNSATTSLNGNFMTHEVVIVEGFDTPDVTPTDLHAAIPALPNGATAAKPMSLANPIDIVFSQEGERAYVTGFGPGRVGVLDGDTARVIARVDVGRGPRALAVNGQTLYVHNRTDHSISRLDITEQRPEVVETYELFNPEPAEIVEGRDFLYSTDFSADGQSSCASCHFDAHHDGLGWDLGNPHATELLPSPPFIDGVPGGQFNHPTKGTMVTQSLRGLRNHNPFHWRGDKPQFTDFNEAFENLLGGAELPAADMDRYDAFIKTIEYQPNYYFNRDNSFKDVRALDGAVVFLNFCERCHTLDHDGASREFGFGADEGMPLGGILAQIQLVTQLREISTKFDNDLYQGFGLIHDGRERREDNPHPINTFADTFFPAITPQGQEDLIDFLTAFPTNATNVVGWQVTATAGDADAITDIELMMDQAQNQAPTRCDVIAQGVVEGERRGYLFEKSLDVEPPQWTSDLNESLSLDQVLDLLNDGESLVFMAVPPGSGTRIALDADQDGTFNGLDQHPFSTPDFDNDGIVDVLDLLDMLALWFELDRGADYDCNTVVNILDLLAFLVDWFALSA